MFLMNLLITIVRMNFGKLHVLVSHGDFRSEFYLPIMANNADITSLLSRFKKENLIGIFIQPQFNLLLMKVWLIKYFKRKQQKRKKKNGLTNRWQTVLMNIPGYRNIVVSQLTKPRHFFLMTLYQHVKLKTY